jgi:hypothetical protein
LSATPKPEPSPSHEKQFRPALDDIFRDLDAAGAADFELKRDLSLPVDRDWL